MTRKIRLTAGLFRAALERCIRHNTSLLSAALAFYGLLSLAPALYFVVAAGTFKTQMGRFGTSPTATARHLLQALLWGPIMVLMLLPRRKLGP